MDGLNEDEIIINTAQENAEKYLGKVRGHFQEQENDCSRSLSRLASYVELEARGNVFAYGRAILPWLPRPIVEVMIKDFFMLSATIGRVELTCSMGRFAIAKLLVIEALERATQTKNAIAMLDAIARQHGSLETILKSALEAVVLLWLFRKPEQAEEGNTFRLHFVW